MQRFALTLLLVACSGADTTTTATFGAPGSAAAFPDMRGPTNTDAIGLHQLQGTYTLGAAQLAGNEADVYKLDAEEIPNSKNAPRKLKVIRATMPFPMGGQQFRPAGMTVFVKGREVPYVRGKAADASEPTWRISGKHLVMSYPTIPGAGQVEVHVAGSSAILTRHDFEASGKSPEEFVRYDVTLQGQTRHGLLLPAPSTASWEVTIPVGKPVFRTWLTLEKAPIAEPSPDGADVVLIAAVDGVTTEIATQGLEPGTPTFAPWTVDLSALAGKTVQLSLETRQRQNNHFDWVFVASPTLSGSARGPVKRVVVVAMDTTRPDHFGFNGYDRDTTPAMDEIASQSVVFTHTWSTAPRTRPSFRSSTTGRYPLKAVGATNLGEVFQQHGFSTAGIVANVHLQPRFDFDHGFDWWRFDGKSNADQQVDLALEWLRENQDRDTYLFLHFMDAHLPYRAPGDFKMKYVEDPDPTLPANYSRWDVTKWSKKGDIPEVRKAHIEGMHDGEMAFMSEQLGRFFSELDGLDGDTVALIQSDHGEEFWEHGAYEHNHTLYDEVTRTVLWMRPKGGLTEGLKVSTPASVMDIAPTLYDLMGWADVPETDGRSLAPLLDGEDDADWSRPLPLAFLQYEKERWGVVFNAKKYILHTGSGWEELYHLDADPKETKNLARSKTINLQPWREALAEAHGVPVRPGFRVRVNLRPNSPPVTIAMPVPALGADVLDPEATLARRANIEWGEAPKHTADEIGTVELSDDGTKLVFTPGAEPSGTLWVQFNEPQTADVQIFREGIALEMDDGKNESRRWRENKFNITVTPGMVLVPPPGEAALMAALSGEDGEPPDEDALRLLKELGYIEP